MEVLEKHTRVVAFRVGPHELLSRLSSLSRTNSALRSSSTIAACRSSAACRSTPTLTSSSATERPFYATSGVQLRTGVPRLVAPGWCKMWLWVRWRYSWLLSS